MVHPDEPVGQERTPKTELSTHAHAILSSGRKRDMLPSALPDLDQSCRVTYQALASGRKACPRLVPDPQSSTDVGQDTSSGAPYVRGPSSPSPLLVIHVAKSDEEIIIRKAATSK